MAAKIIQCICGGIVEEDFNKATIVVSIKAERYAEWMCSDCGQVYRRLMKEPVIVQ